MKTVYLVEKCGDTRSIYGPYTLDHARREAGVRYALVTGRGLENGQSIRRAELAVAVQTGRIVPCDGSDPRSLA